MTPSLSLSRWIYDNYPYSDALTHLKLQKLLFYCVGAAMAFDQDGEFGAPIEFQPWEHGPVNVPVWSHLKDQKGGPLRPEAMETITPATYPKDATSPMRWALAIYGALDAWGLRQQSHLEQPWIDAWERKARRIGPTQMREHFRKKFCGNKVFAPEYLQDPGTFTVDYLPVASYQSMQDLASTVLRIYRR